MAEIMQQQTNPYLDTIEGVKHPTIGKAADFLTDVNRRLEGSPAELVAPEGLEDYLRKVSYGDDISYLDRVFANPLL